jgi:hypothetical protein
MLIPATGLVIGTPAAMSPRHPPHTEAIDEEPLLSKISLMTRMVYGKSSGSGKTASSDRSASIP